MCFLGRIPTALHTQRQASHTELGQHCTPSRETSSHSVPGAGSHHGVRQARSSTVTAVSLSLTPSIACTVQVVRGPFPPTKLLLPAFTPNSPPRRSALECENPETTEDRFRGDPRLPQSSLSAAGSEVSAIDTKSCAPGPGLRCVGGAGGAGQPRSSGPGCDLQG